jgi:hypothetical protein
MEIIVLGFEITRKLAFKAGPYLVVELLLPGGTLLALALYLYRRRASRQDVERPMADDMAKEAGLTPK